MTRRRTLQRGWFQHCRDRAHHLTALCVRGNLFMSRESSMSHTEELSKPLAAFFKLAVMLRHFPGLRFIFSKLAALLRGNRARGEPGRSEFAGEAPRITSSTVDQETAVLKPSSIRAVVEPETDDQPEREKLIRRRWAETGIKMWNPDVHGAGRAALNIQGRVELLPPEPGETLPRYDKLEFKLVRSCIDGQEVNQIVCEGVVVDPPNPRARRWSL